MDVEGRGQVEEWLQASVQLQRLLHPLQETSLVSTAASATGGFELNLCMTVQTPLLAAKIRAWQELQDVRCQGVCAAVRFPREAELVLQGAVSSPVQPLCLSWELFTFCHY